MENKYKFNNFFDTFMKAIDPSLKERDVGTWLFYYSEERYGKDEKVRADDLTHAKNDDRVPKWVREGVVRKPGTALVNRFRNGLRTQYKLCDPNETISKFTHIIEGASNVPTEAKEKIIAYAKEETLPEFLAMLYAYSITNNILDLSVEEPTQVADESIRLMTYHDLLMQGLDSIEIAENLVRNDRSLYPNIADDNEGTPEIWETQNKNEAA